MSKYKCRQEHEEIWHEVSASEPDEAASHFAHDLYYDSTYIDVDDVYVIEVMNGDEIRTFDVTAEEVSMLEFWARERED